MLTIRNLSLRLEDRQILNGVSFTLRPQRLTVLLGKNGSGKSTLLSCVNQQLPYTGEILTDGRSLAQLSPRERAKTVAIAPQNIPAPHITVFQMAAFGRNPYLDFTGRLSEQDIAAVKAALCIARAENLTERYVDTLSGGERQRVAFAMILAQNTPVMLLDEPTAHMDQGHEAVFLRTLTGLKESQKKTVLIVLHDLNTAIRYADDLLVLDGGQLMFSGTKEEILKQRILEETFGVCRYSITQQGGERVFFAAE